MSVFVPFQREGGGESVPCLFLAAHCSLVMCCPILYTIVGVLRCLSWCECGYLGSFFVAKKLLLLSMNRCVWRRWLLVSDNGSMVGCVGGWARVCVRYPVMVCAYKTRAVNLQCDISLVAVCGCGGWGPWGLWWVVSCLACMCAFSLQFVRRLSPYCDCLHPCTMYNRRAMCTRGCVSGSSSRAAGILHDSAASRCPMLTPV